MAEETQTAAAESQVEDAAGEQPQEGQTDAHAEQVDDEKPEADGKVRRANEEARKYRERAKKAEAELQELQKAGMSEQDRQREEFEQAKTRVADLQTTTTHLRVQLAALKAGVRPALAADIPKLVDLGEVEDMSDEKQIDRAVKAFLKERQEYMGGAVDLDAAAVSGARLNGKPTLGSFIRREAGIN